MFLIGALVLILVIVGILWFFEKPVVKTCKECKFYEPIVDKEDGITRTGYCIGLPPSLVFNSKTGWMESYYPQVGDDTSSCSMARGKVS